MMRNCQRVVCVLWEGIVTTILSILETATTKQLFRGFLERLRLIWLLLCYSAYLLHTQVLIRPDWSCLSNAATTFPLLLPLQLLKPLLLLRHDRPKYEASVAWENSKIHLFTYLLIYLLARSTSLRKSICGKQLRQTSILFRWISHYYCCNYYLLTTTTLDTLPLAIFVCFLGIFFVLPCIESYQKVDLRTITLGVPPQEVRTPNN